MQYKVLKFNIYLRKFIFEGFHQFLINWFK